MATTTRLYTFGELSVGKTFKITETSPPPSGYAALIQIRADLPSGMVTVYESPFFNTPPMVPSGYYIDSIHPTVDIPFVDFANSPIDPSTGLFWNCEYYVTMRTYPTGVVDPGYSDRRDLIYYEGKKAVMTNTFKIICESETSSSLFINNTTTDYSFVIGQGNLSYVVDEISNVFLQDGNIIDSSEDNPYSLANPFTTDGTVIEGRSNAVLTYTISNTNRKYVNYYMNINLAVRSEKELNCSCTTAICEVRAKLKCALEKYNKEAANKQQNLENVTYLSAVLTLMQANVYCNEGECTTLLDSVDCGCGCGGC